MKPVHDATCAVACSADIVHDLSEGARRFSELEKACPGISPRTLSERLRWLEEEGVVARHSYAETPPRVEYELTPKGIGLLPVIEAMRQFGHDWLVHDPDHVH
jgi:DNA-binding HxlR family transcriptional regulator